MIDISRKRYVVIRNNDEIFCGLARSYQFKKIADIANTAIKTYLSENKARSAVDSSYRWNENTMRVVEVFEIIQELKEDNNGTSNNV